MYKNMREYFEQGCICCLTGKMKAPKHLTDDDEIAEYYNQNCACTRHCRDVESNKEIPEFLAIQIPDEWISPEGVVTVPAPYKATYPEFDGVPVKHGKEEVLQ